MATIWRSPPESEPARCLQAVAELGEDVRRRTRGARRSCLGAGRAPSARFSSMRQRGEHVVGLRHEADARARRACWPSGRVMSSPVERDRAAAHLDQPEDRLQQRRLAGAVRADDADRARPGAAIEAAAVEDVDAGQVAGDQRPSSIDDRASRRGGAPALRAARSSSPAARRSASAFERPRRLDLLGIGARVASSASSGRSRRPGRCRGGRRGRRR